MASWCVEVGESIRLHRSLLECMRDTPGVLGPIIVKVSKVGTDRHGLEFFRVDHPTYARRTYRPWHHGQLWDRVIARGAGA